MSIPTKTFYTVSYLITDSLDILNVNSLPRHSSPIHSRLTYNARETVSYHTPRIESKIRRAANFEVFRKCGRTVLASDIYSQLKRN